MRSLHLVFPASRRICFLFCAARYSAGHHPHSLQRLHNHNRRTGITIHLKPRRHGKHAPVRSHYLLCCRHGRHAGKTRCTGSLLQAIVKRINSDGSMILATMIVGYVTSLISCSQPMAHVLTGRLMAPVFQERKVAPEIFPAASKTPELWLVL